MLRMIERGNATVSPCYFLYPYHINYIKFVTIFVTPKRKF